MIACLQSRPTKDGFWTAGAWELTMVVLIAAALVYVLAVGFVERAPAPATQPGFQDPAAIRYLFNNPQAATFWTMIRFYVGFEWFAAGYAKIIGKEGDWMTNGTALKGFWTAVPALNHKGGNPALCTGSTDEGRTQITKSEFVVPCNLVNQDGSDWG